MPPFNHSEAERIISATDVKRHDGMSRSDALLGKTTTPTPPAPPTKKPSMPRPRKNNTVLSEMHRKKYTEGSEAVFAKVDLAVAAARASCQKGKDGVQSKQAMDALLERTLNDLILVLAGIRDERKVIIGDRSSEEKAHPSLIP